MRGLAGADIESPLVGWTFDLPVNHKPPGEEGTRMGTLAGGGVVAVGQAVERIVPSFERERHDVVDRQARGSRHGDPADSRGGHRTDGRGGRHRRPRFGLRSGRGQRRSDVEGRLLLLAENHGDDFPVSGPHAPVRRR